MKLKELTGEDWFVYLQPFFKSEAFEKIQATLKIEMSATNHKLIPSLDKVFEPFKSCPFKELKVILLNDCPVKELDTNDGLAFSSNRINTDIPDEIEEFFSGIEREVYDGFQIKQDYDYHRLAKQGVLMLNYSMTLVYQELGLKTGKWLEHYWLWKPFLEYLIVKLCADNKGLIFITFGKKPREFAGKILQSDNYLFTCTHPSDYTEFSHYWDSAGAFSLTNEILLNNTNTKIEW